MKNPKAEREMYPMPPIPTVESLGMVHRYRQTMRRARPRLLQKFPHRRPKPAQPTIIRRGTMRSLNYLLGHGLASFAGCNLMVAAYSYRNPLTTIVENITDGSETCGV